MSAPERLGHPSFSAMLDSAPGGDDSDEGERLTAIDDGWQQGKGAFGGLVLGLLVGAMERVEGSPRQLRSLTAQIPAPALVGPARTRASTLRRGRSLSTHRAELIQEGAVVAHASAVFGDGRESARDIRHGTETGTGILTPARPRWSELQPMSGFVPFSRHFEYRMTTPPPGSAKPGQPVPATTTGWINFCDHSPDAPFGAPEITALIDAYWPAHFTALTRIRPSATVSFFLYLAPLAELAAPLTGDRPLYYEARTEHCADGFSNERRALFTEAGELVAINNQTFALLG